MVKQSNTYSSDIKNIWNDSSVSSTWDLRKALNSNLVFIENPINHLFNVSLSHCSPPSAELKKQYIGKNYVSISASLTFLKTASSVTISQSERDNTSQ